MLPRDLWKIGAIIVAGMDLSAFRDKIRNYWGTDPFEFYINTEFTSYIGTLNWNRKALTLAPYVCFLEFIPEAESAKRRLDPSYQPSTVLLNQVVDGQLYELVFTNFHGGVFTRYLSGDMLKVVGLEDTETAVKLPQFVVKGRADKLIDIGGFTRLDERTIWQALEDSGVKYENWVARKESEGDTPVLRLYLETAVEDKADHIAEKIHSSLKKFDSSYRDLDEMLGTKPLRVTMFPRGTTTEWEQELIKSGADSSWIKGQHMQPTEQVMQKLKSIAEKRLGGVLTT